MKKSLVFIAAVLTWSALCPRTFAVLVSHSVDGVLINDGFEGDTVGNPPAGWTSTSNVDVVTSGFGTPAAPAANEGSNHLLAPPFVGPNLSGSYQSFANGPYTSGVLSATFAFYVPSSGAQNNVFATFQDAAGIGFLSSEHWFGFAASDYINTYTNPDITVGLGGVYYYNGSTENNLTAGGTSYTYSLDAWHEAALSYNIDTQTLTITVDGTTLDALSDNGANSTGSVTGFAIQGNGNGVGYVDAVVPEPLSLTLMVLGMAGCCLFRCVRR